MLVAVIAGGRAGREAPLGDAQMAVVDLNGRSGFLLAHVPLLLWFMGAGRLSTRKTSSVLSGSGCAHAVEKDGADDHATEQDLLNVAADFEQVHGVGPHGDEDRSQNGRNDAADAALQADTADHSGGDALKDQAAANI